MLFAALLLQSVAVASQDTASSFGDPVSVLEAAMSSAEKHLAENEMEAAESEFRSALLEGWLLLGSLELADGDLHAAATAFDAASVSAVETRRALTARASVALQLGEHEMAISLLRKVLFQTPESGPLRRLLAQALVADGRPGEAVQELEETRARNPDDPETTFALGSGYLRLGQVAEARSLFEQVAAVRPIPQTWVLIGRVYRDFREYELARDSFRKALEMDDGVRRARYYLGTIELLSLGRDGLEAAVPLFEGEIERYPDDPMTNLYLGLALSEYRQFDEAIPPLEIAASWPPTRLNALRFLGRCHLGAGRPAEAESALTEALELASGEASPRQLAQIHYQLGQTLRRLGEVARAAPHFEAARESSGDLVDIERDRFQRFLSDAMGVEPGSDSERQSGVGGLDTLSFEMRRALRERLEISLARCYFNLGTLLARANRFARALDLFRPVAALDPDFPNLHRALGVAAFNAGDFALAAGQLERATAGGAGDLDLERLLALAWLNMGAYAQAAEVLEREALRASDPALEFTYALALVRAGQVERAAAVFDRLVSSYSDWPELHVLLGQAFAEQEDFESAVVSLQRALELDEAVADANTALGEIFMRQGRLEEAEQALLAELARRPGATDARYLLAVVLDLASRPAQAVQALRQVLTEQPDHADARYLMGKIRLAEGEAADAARHLEAAALLAPGDSNIRYQLAQALQRLGQRDKAAEQFEIYRRLKREEQEGTS